MSIANSRCADRFLECQLVWARARFADFVFSIGDTLRIYNYMTLGHPSEGRVDLDEATLLARAEGDAWLESNRPLIEKHLAPDSTRIVRWDEWKGNPGFEERLSHLTRLYTVGGEFASVLDSDIQQYIRRGQAQSMSVRESERRQLATYLLEELAVYQLQAETEPAVHLYPGSMMEVFRRIRGFEGIPTALRERDYVYLDIKERAG